MTGTIKTDRSSTLNLEGVTVPILTAFLNSLPAMARDTGKVEITHSPYLNQFDRGYTLMKVTWQQDIGSPSRK